MNRLINTPSNKLNCGVTFSTFEKFNQPEVNIESPPIYQNTPGQMRKTELYDSNPDLSRFIVF